MSIEKNTWHYFPTYKPICDCCLTALYTICGEEFDSFDEAIRGMKSAGWKTTKEYGEWENYCPECWADIHRQSAINDFKDL